MPNVGHIMNDLTVLKRAAFLMGEPVYLLGDDFKDYFNQLESAPEELWKSGIAFLREDDALDTQYAPGTAVFVSERRMGFGLHPNSNVAQQLSEALNDLFRKDVDRVEDALLEADTRPAAQQWLASRRTLEETKKGHQRRLYFVHMYCDDNIIGVVGVQRTIRLLHVW